MFCLGATLGCLALGMVHQLSGGAWGVVLRRPIGAATRVLPIMTLLFLPIVLGMGRLYSGRTPDVVATDEILQHKHLYLNTPFFLVRAALYFLVWNGISYFLNRWSLEQDRTGDPRLSRRMQRLSAARPRGLRPDDHLRVVRLADVARSALVFDDLRRADHRRPGADRDCVADCGDRVAQPPGAARPADRARPLSRRRQPDARLRHAVGVLRVLAVPDHLGRRSAARDRAGISTRLQTGWRTVGVAAGRRALRRAVPRAAVAAGQAHSARSSKKWRWASSSSAWSICSG